MRPVRYARIGGALYLVIMVAGIVGPWILGLLVQIAGVSYLVSSSLLLVATDLANMPPCSATDR